MKGSSVTPNTWPGGRGGKPAVVGGLAGAGQRGQGAYAYAPPRSLVAGTESRRTAPEQARILAPASTAHGKCSRTTCSPAAGRSPRGWSRRQTPRRTAQPPAAPAAAGWPHARRPAGGRGGAGLGTCACLEKHAPHPLAPGNQAPGVLDTPEKAGRADQRAERLACAYAQHPSPWLACRQAHAARPRAAAGELSPCGLGARAGARRTLTVKKRSPS